MKKKRSLLIITTTFAFLLACQSVTQPSSNNPNTAPTQEVVVQPSDECIPVSTVDRLHIRILDRWVHRFGNTPHA